MRKLFAAILLLAAGSVQAAVVFTLVESGGNVVLSGTGSVDLTGLTFDDEESGGSPFINPSISAFRAGDTDSLADYDVYAGALGPASIGTGSSYRPREFSTGSGDAFGFHIDNSRIDPAGMVNVPRGYVSGSSLTGTGVFTGHTFESLGVTTGTYVWSWASDSITLNVIPIPASVWLFGSALAGLGWMRRKKTS
jgi:hypothetical protein